MYLFKKKESITQNITYMAMMAAINVIFVLLSYFVPVLTFVLVFFLPLTSTMVTLLCNKKYLPIYVLATIGLCLLTTMKDVSDTLFYVIPSLFSGIIFGFCIDKKISSMFSICVAIIVTVGFTYAFIPLINFIYKCNIIEVYAGIFGLKDFKYLDYTVPAFIFLISLIQTLITFIVIKTQLPKLGYETNDSILFIPTIFCCFISMCLTLIFAFVYAPLTLLFSFAIFYFLSYLIIETIMQKKMVEIIVIVSSLLITVILYITLFQYVNQPLPFLIFDSFPLLCIVSFAFIHLITKYSNNKKLS